MCTGSDQNRGKPISKIRLIVLVLGLTLVVFGIIGAWVTLIPQTERLLPLDRKGKAPQVRQIDREGFDKKAPVPGS